MQFFSGLNMNTVAVWVMAVCHWNHYLFVKLPVTLCFFLCVLRWWSRRSWRSWCCSHVGFIYYWKTFLHCNGRRSWPANKTTIAKIPQWNACCSAWESVRQLIIHYGSLPHCVAIWMAMIVCDKMLQRTVATHQLPHQEGVPIFQVLSCYKEISPKVNSITRLFQKSNTCF